MNLKNLTIFEIVDNIKSGDITCEHLTQYYINNIKKYQSKNAVLEVFEDALSRAREIDKMVSSGLDLPPLVGVPILIKDNIMYKGKICSSASKILEHYKAEYNATVIDKLLDAGVVILGRTNMDEFAMGGSCENSAYGACKNAWDDNRVSGGSSGGSAVAVALDMCAFALGSDTGGSVRQPSSYNGVYGIKPTNSRVSRFGLMAYAGTLDTVGVIAKNYQDVAYVLSIISGKDKHDETSSNMPVENYLAQITGDIKGKKIAIIKEVQELINKTEHVNKFQEVLSYCQKHGAIITETSIKEYVSILPVYYTIAMAEATTNMNRFDGIRFTDSVDADTFSNIILRTRSSLLGKEVKRRIMIGNFVLSSEHYSSYYLKAKKLAEVLKLKFYKVLEENDILFMPTTYGEAFEIGSKVSDPVSMYIEDIFTVTANILGVPALNVPYAKGSHGLPLGLQIISKPFNEKEIFNMADFLAQIGDER